MRHTVLSLSWVTWFSLYCLGFSLHTVATMSLVSGALLLRKKPLLRAAFAAAACATWMSHAALAQSSRFHFVDLATRAPLDVGPNALVDEGDAVVAGSAMLAVQGRLPPAESAHVTRTMRDAYARLRREEGVVPTPMRLDGSEGPTLVIEPRASASTPQLGIVYLHGYGGSFALQCGWLAEAADSLGARTVCPSIGVSGHWATARGAHKIDDAIRYLRQRGASKIVLAGLSNGGASLSRLAPSLARRADGFILLSGAAAGTAPTSRPTLVIQGSRDAMMPPSLARRYARAGSRQGKPVRYVELEGTHFVLAEQIDAVRQHVGSWLASEVLR